MLPSINKLGLGSNSSPNIHLLHSSSPLQTTTTEELEMRGFVGALEAGPSCPLYAPPPRLSPPVSHSPSRSSVGVHERSPQLQLGVCTRGWSQQSRPLQARQRLPRSNLAVWGGVRHVHRRQCCCHRVPIAGGLGRVDGDMHGILFAWEFKNA